MSKRALLVVAAGATFLATALPAAMAQAGVTIVMQRGADKISTLYVDGDKMRAENLAGREQTNTVIIDATARHMLMINEAEKSYTEVTEADMKRFGEVVAAQRAQMQERMKSMPPEQRKRMEAMGMGGPAGKEAKPRALKFERLGAKKSINGFSCEMYRVVEETTPKEEDCLATWSASVLQRSDFEGLRKFAEDMAKDAGAMSPGGGRQMFEQFDKYPGFPVLRHPLEPGQHEDEQLKSVKRGSIPAVKFGVPAGFTKKESPMGKGMGMGMGAPPRGPFKPLPPPK